MHVYLTSHHLWDEGNIISILQIQRLSLRKAKWLGQSTTGEKVPELGLEPVVLKVSPAWYSLQREEEAELGKEEDKQNRAETGD